MTGEAYPKVIICIPAYNEAKHIQKVIEGTRLYATEIIVCDDGSVDETAKLAREAGATVVSHTTNKGYGAAIKTLFRIARERNADVMVTLDSDGQHEPEQILNVINPIVKSEFDIVIGSRFINKDDRKKVPLYRTIGIKTITKFVQMASYNNLTDAQSGFRAYSKRALSAILLSADGMAVSTEILMRGKDNNLRITEVPITINYDVEESSTHNPISHGSSVLASVIGFISIKHPLKFYSLSGLATFAIGIVFVAWTLDIRASSGIWSTNTILISVGAIAIGIALFLCGIVLYSISMMLRGQRGYS